MKQRLQEERKFVRGKVLAAFDETFEDYSLLVVLGVCTLFLGITECYEQLAPHNQWRQSWPMFFVGLTGIVCGVILFWYIYSKVKTDRQLKKHIQEGNIYKQVRAFFELRWLAVKAQPLFQSIDKGIKQAEALELSYWIELTKKEEQHGKNIPVAEAKRMQEKKRIQEASQDFYKRLKLSTAAVVRHQLEHAPAMNQDKEFYFSRLESLEKIAQVFGLVKTSSEAEAVLQQLLDEIKRSAL